VADFANCARVLAAMGDPIVETSEIENWQDGS
jgi:hypothetical protein